jgi:hypothetical protein
MPWTRSSTAPPLTLANVDQVDTLTVHQDLVNVQHLGHDGRLGEFAREARGPVLARLVELRLPSIFLRKLFAQAAIWSAFSKVSRASMRIPSVGPEISVPLDGAQVATSRSPL